MISKFVKQFCKDPIEWIENYQEAVNDTTQVWHCHHRFEIDYNMSSLELQALGFYFNRPFYELIFLTPEEHKSLHKKGKEGYWKGKVGPNKGKEGYWKGKKRAPFSDEWKQKLSNARKGREGENAPNCKYHITKEELYDLYIVQGLSKSKIAEMYGCTSWVIWWKLKKYNIKK